MFRNKHKQIYYYAGVWTCINYKTLRSHQTKFAWRAMNWLGKREL